MTYIINPWFFYFASLLDGLWILISIVLFLAIVGTVGFGIWWLIEAYDSDFFVHDDKETPFANFCKKMIKISAIATIISAVLMVVVPSEKAVNKMMISSFVTKENVEKTKEGAKEIVDYIAEKAIEIKKAE